MLDPTFTVLVRGEEKVICQDVEVATRCCRWYESGEVIRNDGEVMYKWRADRHEAEDLK